MMNARKNPHPENIKSSAPRQGSKEGMECGGIASGGREGRSKQEEAYLGRLFSSLPAGRIRVCVSDAAE